MTLSCRAPRRCQEQALDWEVFCKFMGLADAANKDATRQ